MSKTLSVKNMFLVKALIVSGVGINVIVKQFAKSLNANIRAFYYNVKNAAKKCASIVKITSNLTIVEIVKHPILKKMVSTP